MAPGDRLAWGGLRPVVQDARVVGWGVVSLDAGAVLRPEKEAAE